MSNKLKVTDLYNKGRDEKSNDEILDNLTKLEHELVIDCNSIINGSLSEVNNPKLKQAPAHDVLNAITTGIPEAIGIINILDSTWQKYDSTIADYWYLVGCTAKGANNSIKRLCFGTNIKLVILNLFYALKNSLMNEFDWMEDELDKGLKESAVAVMEYSEAASMNMCIDEIYYYASFIDRDNQDKDSFNNEVSLLVNPIAESMATDITAYTLGNIYDVLFNILATNATSEDFNTIAMYIKPYILDFKSDLVHCIRNTIHQIVYTRSTLEIQASKFINELSKEFDTPNYYENK